MANSYEEYTGKDCEQGHPMYYQVLEIRSGGRMIDKRKRGPSCWYATCPDHIDWQSRTSQ